MVRAIQTASLVRLNLPLTDRVLIAMSVGVVLSDPYLLEKIFDSPNSSYRDVRSLYITGSLLVRKAIGKTRVQKSGSYISIGIAKSMQIYRSNPMNDRKFPEKAGDFVLESTIEKVTVFFRADDPDMIKTQIENLPNLKHYHQMANPQSEVHPILPDTVVSYRYSMYSPTMAPHYPRYLTSLTIESIVLADTGDVIDFSTLVHVNELTFGKWPHTRIGTRRAYTITLPPTLKKLVSECYFTNIAENDIAKFSNIKHFNITDLVFVPHTSEVAGSDGNLINGMRFESKIDLLDAKCSEKAKYFVQKFYDQSFSVSCTHYSEEMLKTLSQKHTVWLWGDQTKYESLLQETKHLIYRHPGRGVRELTPFPSCVTTLELPSVDITLLGDFPAIMSNITSFKCREMRDVCSSSKNYTYRERLIAVSQRFVASLPLSKMSYLEMIDEDNYMYFCYDAKKKYLKNGFLPKICPSIFDFIETIETFSLYQCRDMKNLKKITIDNQMADPGCADLEEFPNLLEFDGPNYTVISLAPKITKVRAYDIKKNLDVSKCKVILSRKWKIEPPTSRY